MDLQKVDLNKSIKADLIDVKIKNLQWITPAVSF